MQQFPLGRALGIVERHGAAARQRMRFRSRQFFAGDQNAAAALAPEMGEVALARTRRAMEDERVRRPFRPALDPAEGGGIALGYEKIGAAERRAVRQIDRELGHRMRVRLAMVSLSPWLPLSLSRAS